MSADANESFAGTRSRKANPGNRSQGRTSPRKGEYMNSEFKNRVAFITGASSGIGAATALAFAQQGANVVIADVNPKGEEVASAARKLGVQAIYQKCDTASPFDVENAIKRTLQEFGHLHYAFNNAGVDGAQAPTSECTEENWDKVLSINLKGVWLCMKYQIPQMLKQGSGVIVNCSSVAGLMGFAGIPAYTASKHGVIGLTKAAALELAPRKIRVNAICPGVIDTPMVDHYVKGDAELKRQMIANEPIGRMGKPEEVADSVLWLCSSRSSFVTGVALPVDGGWTASS